MEKPDDCGTKKKHLLPLRASLHTRKKIPNLEKNDQKKQKKQPQVDLFENFNQVVVLCMHTRMLTHVHRARMKA